MRLEHAGSTIDVDERLRKEYAALPETFTLCGEKGLCELARSLLAERDVHESKGGQPVTVTSLETHASEVLAALLEDRTVPEGPVLFATVPHAALAALAKRCAITLAPEPHTGVREMLDRIAAEQPQTYLALSRSIERLGPHLRNMSGNGD